MVSQVSIDGKITLGRGVSSKKLFELLTEEDEKYIHTIRDQVDGILVGMNTIRTDNPMLTCRYHGGNDPVRIIPSNSMNIPKNSNVFNDDVETIFLTNSENVNKTKTVNMRKNKHVLLCGEKQIDFHMAIELLEKEYNIKSIMLEGGGMVNWSLIEADLVDEIIIMQLPIIIGGVDNTSLVDGTGYKKIDNVSRFTFCGMEMKENICIFKYVRKNKKSNASIE